MKQLFNRKPKIDLIELHQYTQDLERITMLRDKTDDEMEKARYDIVIECMQRVVITLTKQQM